MFKKFLFETIKESNEFKKYFKTNARQTSRVCRSKVHRS